MIAQEGTTGTYQSRWYPELSEPDVAELERAEESQRQMQMVLARQARRAAPVPLPGPQVADRRRETCGA